MTETKNAVKAAEKDTKEVEDRIAADLEKGYRGTVPDPLPNSAHSLESGPDSPPLIPDNETRFAQHAAQKEA